MLNPKQVFKMNQIKPKTSNSYLKTNNYCLNLSHFNWNDSYRIGKKDWFWNIFLICWVFTKVVKRNAPFLGKKVNMRRWHQKWHLMNISLPFFHYFLLEEGEGNKGVSKIRCKIRINYNFEGGYT